MEREPALRAELFNADQLEAYGLVLAGRHVLAPRRTPDWLRPRLADNGKVILEACRALVSVERKGEGTTPAGEWLLDNLYLIEEHVRIAGNDFPKGYSRELVQLDDGPSKGLPRVYDIALEVISHGDGRIDASGLARFLHAYQSVQPLNLGELWAIPIMLRLALIENLRRVAVRVTLDRARRRRATRWANAMTRMAAEDPKNVVLVVADMARSSPAMSAPFVAELARRLQGQGPTLAMPLGWIEQRLAESGRSVDYMVQLESQQQAAHQVSVSNSIGSLRALATVDWHDFVEAASLVEDTLRTDPAGIYTAMDFATRDRYRHAVERLSRRGSLDEVATAKAVIAACQHATPTHSDPIGAPLERHVGYHLIGAGKAAMERRLEARHSAPSRHRRIFDTAPLGGSLLALLILTVALAIGLVGVAAPEAWPWWALLLLGLGTVIVASQLALSLLNLLATLVTAPDRLPRMDYARGIPVSARTMVAVPTLLGGTDDVDDVVEALEVRFLANRDPSLHFALLTDFLDSETESLPGDGAIYELACQRIAALNAKYPSATVDTFYLFHRPRQWSDTEQRWIGADRKRGKLAAMNALLRGEGADHFLPVIGRLATLPRVRYVITLDTDTQLPRDAARVLIATMDHPLNRPVFDEKKRIVVSGYGIMQPRAGIGLPASARSEYALLYGADAGIDPYTRAVSDVYQDLFHEGSFIGKGIYDVDAFERALAGRLRSERVLSHDLIEGCFARSALLSDVTVFETIPERYIDDSSRRHRWMRGDWQLLPWLLPRVRMQHGWGRNDLPGLARWKIFDNLRRALVAPAATLLFVAGWLFVTPALTWTLGVLSMTFIPVLLQALMDASHKPRDIDWQQHARTSLVAAGQHGLRLLLSIAWLPHEAGVALDAAFRSLWRMVVSKRHLLEWRSSSEVEKGGRNDRRVPWRKMLSGPAVAVLVAMVVGSDRPGILMTAAPLLVLWALSPVLAWWVSRPRTDTVFAPGEADQRFLRALARRTWSFFDTYVGPDEHWLPPDNVQMVPERVVAQRTSPTNMGLALLANLSAYDFGFAGSGRVAARVDATLSTMRSLERYRGHFYNWYDTQTLAPLYPLYVSSVDSGNLAGHLITLQRGLLALPDEPVFRVETLKGLCDTARVMADVLDTHASAALQPWTAALEAAIDVPPTTPSEVLALARAQHVRLDVIAPMLAHEASSDALFWLAALQVQCNELLSEAELWATAWPAHAGLPTLRMLASGGHAAAASRIAALLASAAEAGAMAVMDQAFLYDPHRHLFSIGYDIERRTIDGSYYDLLASEARLTSFVAIAQGQVPQENWFSLGRLLTAVGGTPVLLSWTGSMFEYLMPMLVMPTYEGSLLDQTCRAAVARQVEYGRQRGLPWGVSESGYNAFDTARNYQYRAFGVPGLGLKRGLGDDMVVAPYATALALMVSPVAATANLRLLDTVGMASRHGHFEAIDYTPSRVPPGQSGAIVQSYMAHHQGMSLLSIAHVLLDQPMRKRFESDPNVMATSLLLQERIPLSAVEYLHSAGFGETSTTEPAPEARLRLFTDPDRPRPAVQLLSNGRYHVMVSSAGGGYSRCNGIAMTRWREDITRDNHGMFCYVRDVESGDVWTTSYQPVGRRTDRFEAIFSEARAEFRVRHRNFDAHTEIVVSPEDDIELRRTRVTNRGRTRRTIELTSYAEVVLADAVGDAMHPAFSKLFVTTEIVKGMQALLCTRRPRAPGDATPWMCHLVAVHDADVVAISYETDRSQFIGRGRSTANAFALDHTQAELSNTAGAVLDPVIAIRVRVTLDPEQTATLDFVTGLADTRDGCMRLIEKYRDRHLSDRVFDLAWTHSQVSLRQANATLADAQLFEHMATSVVYPNLALRAEPSLIAANRRGQSGLWGQAVSGDLPIVLLRIGDIARLDIARDLVRAAAYWRMRGLMVDLVIWNEDSTGYRQALHDALTGLLASGTEASLLDRPGGVFIRAAQPLSYEDRLVMEASACIVVVDSLGSLAEQMERHRLDRRPAVAEPALWARIPRPTLPAAVPPRGAFSADGNEYVIELDAGATTPAPWSNVLANPYFGTVISESGGAYTWAENAHACRLTPWQNDPVGDPSGEAIYLRDEATGYSWSPTPLPMRGDGRYTTRHGFGYSTFEHEEGGIRSQLDVFVALDSPVKFQVVTLTNTGSETRRISLTAYVEWLLGDIREKSAMHVVTEVDPQTGALFARNAYNSDFPGRVAFLDVGDAEREIGGDRAEFLGRNGDMSSPLAMRRQAWSNRVGAGLDPCGTLRTAVELAPGDTREVVFRLGMANSEGDARGLVQRWRHDGSAARELAVVRAHWRDLLHTVQVETPEPAVDRLANGWLLYQTIASRIWARSGYYQSGGAIGFRDQLQDSMATQHAAPAMARAQLITCAAHQFLEGDVLHWWHPPLGRGVRTGCSDDYLWLPLAVSRYVGASGDTGVLAESIEYLDGRMLRPGEESYYDLPRASGVRGSLYEHCVRSIEHSMPRGVHGLPLMGAGDWNDGMNLVGEGGKGESVWLGFFLTHVLREFSEVAARQGDAAFATRCMAEADSLARALENEAWDGEWYRRAWFDDGTPLGSSVNEECRIDAIAQSWSVLSDVAPPARAAQAMASLDSHLVRSDEGLIRLLDPPFDHSSLEPGYIKGYVPGVRENGGQYTHAAIWAVMATAHMGRTERAWELARMILPSSHTADDVGIARYKVEPYVAVADVYSVEPHVGRGGWSWYTGSAGWMYRLVLESLLGVTLDDGALRFAPRVPASWAGFRVVYRHGAAVYRIELTKGEAGQALIVEKDGEAVPDARLTLIDDSAEHDIKVTY